MFKKLFGMLPKKSVSFENGILTIGKFEIKESEISFIDVRPYDFVSNKWGEFYVSVNGETPEEGGLFAKNAFKFTKGQTKYVEQLLSMMDVSIVRKSHREVKTVTQPYRQEPVTKKCPYCDSPNIQFMDNNKKAFSAGKAVGGAVLTGGIGTLAGFAGKKGKTDNWHCSNCGGVFELER